MTKKNLDKKTQKQNRLQAAFEKAVAKHDAKKVSKLIKQGANVNRDDAEGFSPLAQALYFNRPVFGEAGYKSSLHSDFAQKAAILKTVKVLLKAGANPAWTDAKCGYGYNLSQLGFFRGVVEQGDKLDKTLKKAADKKRSAFKR